MITIKIYFNRLWMTTDQVKKIIKPISLIVDKAFNVPILRKVLETRGEKIKSRKVIVKAPQSTLSDEDEHSLDIEIHTNSSPEIMKENYRRLRRIIKNLKETKTIPTEMWVKDQVFVSIILDPAPPAKKFK